MTSILVTGYPDVKHQADGPGVKCFVHVGQLHGRQPIQKGMEGTEVDANWLGLRQSMKLYPAPQRR
jgi:hypothetical protein